MDSNERNIDLLEHIIKYCNEIFETQSYFGNSFEFLKIPDILPSTHT